MLGDRLPPRPVGGPSFERQLVESAHRYSEPPREFSLVDAVALYIPEERTGQEVVAVLLGQAAEGLSRRVGVDGLLARYAQQCDAV